MNDAEMNDLINESRKMGAIIRTRLDDNGCIVAISIGKLPGGQYRKLGQPGTGWMPIIQGAEMLRREVAQ